MSHLVETFKFNKKNFQSIKAILSLFYIAWHTNSIHRGVKLVPCNCDFQQILREDFYETDQPSNVFERNAIAVNYSIFVCFIVQRGGTFLIALIYIKFD